MLLIKLDLIYDLNENVNIFLIIQLDWFILKIPYMIQYKTFVCNNNLKSQRSVKL